MQSYCKWEAFLWNNKHHLVIEKTVGERYFLSQKQWSYLCLVALQRITIVHNSALLPLSSGCLVYAQKVQVVQQNIMCSSKPMSQHKVSNSAQADVRKWRDAKFAHQHTAARLLAVATTAGKQVALDTHFQSPVCKSTPSKQYFLTDLTCFQN